MLNEIMMKRMDRKHHHYREEYLKTKMIESLDRLRPDQLELLHFMHKFGDIPQGLFNE